MKIERPTAAEAEAGLRALKQILRADGVLNPIEEKMLAASQRYVLGTDIDVDALPPITPEALAAAITRPQIRAQLAKAFIIHSFTSGEAGPEQLEQVEAFSRALGTEARELHSLRLLVGQQYALLRFDILRHMYIGEELGRVWSERGVRGVAALVGQFAGKLGDEALAAKYRALEAYPAGSLGRAYFDFCRENGFSLPGEPFAGPELMAVHDLTHVLSGYGTDPKGELQVAAFTAGYRRQQGVTILLFVLAQFDLGLRTVPVAEGEHGNLDPDAFLAALTRGSRVKVDLFDGWDFWAVADRPVVELRAQYGID